MSYIITGLGNPGDEYENTRHNTGRILVDYFRKKNGFSEWTENKKIKALVSNGKIGKSKVTLLIPDNFMNNSGKSLMSLITSVKKAEKLIVVYDDIDLAIGTMKISFNRGSGGHRGLESVIKAVKTKSFVRLRAGISKATPSGKIKKPIGGKQVLDFILGKFTPKELDTIKKVSKDTNKALEMLVEDGRAKAMGEFNQ